MKLILMISGLAMMATSAAHSLPPPKPEQCPAADSFAEAQITSARIQGNVWVSDLPTSNYGTEDKWIVYLDNIEAKSQLEARDMAQQALTGFSGIAEPVWDKDKISWRCRYLSNTNVRIVVFLEREKDHPSQ